MVKVEEYEIIVVLSRIAEACGAMDTVIDFVDQRPATVLKKYRMYLGNTINDLESWLERDDADE